MDKSFGGHWFNQYEHTCRYDIAESFVPPFSLEEIIKLADLDRNQIVDEILSMKLAYGERCGILRLRRAISKIYQTIGVDDMISTHAGVGANELVYSSLYEEGAEAIIIMPTYQQLKSFPEMIGWNLNFYELQKENQYCLDYDQIEKLISPKTKLISLCNPNNPYGKLFSKEELLALAAIAHEHDLYILCDEIYSCIGPNSAVTQSAICDLYDKGITTCSMSKTYSLPGVRIGWIACKDKELLGHIADVRHYHTMECSIVAEYISAIALENRNLIISRNQNVVSQNYAAFAKWVSLRRKMHYDQPDAGPILIVNYDYNVESVALCKDIVEKTGVLLMPGYAFGLENCFRIGLTAKPEVFRKALEALGSYFDGLEGEK